MPLDENAKSLTDPNFSKSGDPQPIADSAGGPSVDFTDATNDVSKSARITLGSYLSTKTEKNKYPISVPAPNASPYEVKSRGEDASLPGAGINNQSYFADGDAPKITLKSAGLGVKNASLQTNNNRQITFFTDDQINDVLSKNAADDSKLGHNLLKDVPEDAVNPNVKINNPVSPRPGDNTSPKGVRLLQHIHDQLVEGNMYSPASESPFIKNAGSTNEEDATRGLFTIQRNLGSFDVNGQRVQVSDMSAIAMGLLLRSVGNMKGSELVIQNKSLGEASFTALTPFLRPEQFGAAGNGIDVYRLKYIKSSFTSATGDTANIASKATGQDDFISLMADGNLLSRGSPPNNDPDLPQLQSFPMNKTSYAQMNSFLDPFSTGLRFSSIGMMLLGISALLAITAVSTVIVRLLNVKNLEFEAERKLGAYKSVKDPPILRRFFEVVKTDNDFSDCVVEGISLMFGVSTSINSSLFSQPGVLLTVAQNMISSGGYYANFCRRIIAESVTIVGAIGKIGTVNVAQSVENVLRGIETLLDSATYKFIMIAAGVGDASIKSRNVSIRYYTTGSGLNPFDQGGYLPDLEKKNDAGGAKLGEVRKFTYRWLDAPGKPNALSLKTFLSTQHEVPTKGTDTNADSSNRFLQPSRENVQKIEDALESEYMPFYIHDLRTHEIMSFPAFITEFGETFSANYNSVEGIGRQDAVRLYQKTERAVTFGFTLAAFNKEDHDHMWWSINKLVAMCYPQYSLGRTRETGAGDNNSITSFIQPFSQVQAASPMVRLRLADVFKSNYSKFGIGRLFGVDVNELKSIDAKNAQRAINAAVEVVKDNLRVQFRTDIENKKVTGKTYKIIPGAKPISDGENKAWSATQEQRKIIDQGVEFFIAQDDTTFGSGKVKGVVPKRDGVELGAVVYSISSLKSYSDSYVKSKIDEDPDVQKARQRLANSQDSKNLPNEDFMNPDINSKTGGNAIVRSFESTRGRGVAGFITSIGLDYGMGSYPWGIDFGYRAPTVVKISLGFTPITDLPLGLDYEGKVRNPSHPVGKLAGSYGDPYYDNSLEGVKDSVGKSSGLETVSEYLEKNR